jgi:phosphoglycolate phosphatase-like HAD superfamily hydrolase
MKAIYWDMDGTIANLYGVDGWLEAIESSQVYPYLVAEPMCDMMELKTILRQLKENGYRMGVITWLSKTGTEEYNRRTRAAKRMWLEVHGLWELMDEVHMVRYGTPKHSTTRLYQGILVDDNKKVREEWEHHGGTTIDPTTTNVIEALNRLMKGEI